MPRRLFGELYCMRYKTSKGEIVRRTRLNQPTIKPQSDSRMAHAVWWRGDACTDMFHRDALGSRRSIIHVTSFYRRPRNVTLTVHSWVVDPLPLFPLVCFPFPPQTEQNTVFAYFSSRFAPVELKVACLLVFWALTSREERPSLWQQTGKPTRRQKG